MKCSDSGELQHQKTHPSIGNSSPSCVPELPGRLAGGLLSLAVVTRTLGDGSRDFLSFLGFDCLLSPVVLTESYGASLPEGLLQSTENDNVPPYHSG